MSATKHTPGPWKVRYFKAEEPEAGFFVEAKNNNRPELNYGIEIMMEDFGEHTRYKLQHLQIHRICGESSIYL